MLKTFDVILDVEKELHHISMPAFNISQSDLDTVQITFAVNQDEAAFDLTDKTIQLAVKKPSGLTVYQNCSITDAINGEATVILAKQAYIEYGFHTGELMISDLDQMLITCPFYYGVRTAIMAAQAEESINDWSALETFLFAMDKKPLVVDGVPTALPEYIGQMAVDTTGKRAFIAYDTTATGWELVAAGEGGGGGIVYWTNILNKPLTFTPAAHTHTMADITDYTPPADTGGGTWGSITGTLADQTDLQTALNGKANTGHTHTAANITDFAAGVAGAIPAEYLTATEADAVYQPKGTYLTAVPPEYLTDTEANAAYSPITHTHTAANITDFGTAVAGAIPAEYLTTTEADAAYQPKGTYLTEVPAEYLTQTEGDARYAIKGTEGGTIAAAWGDIAGTLSNQTDLQTALNGKADTGHTHTAANITDFGTAVAGAIPAEYLTTTEADAAYQAKGTYLTEVPAEYLTTTEADAAYQAKGTYLTEVPAEYLTDTEASAAYAPLTHTHTAANITDFGTAVAGAIPAEYLTTTEADAAYQAKGTYLTEVPAEYLTDTEASAAYAPLTHTHTAANITDFGTAVAGAIPAEYLTDTEASAAYAPLTHTHTAANITDFGTAVAGAIPAEYLTTTEADAAYQAKGTYLTAVPLASTTAVGGGRVGNGLGISGEYLYVRTGAGLGINTTNYALQVQTTRATPTALNFWTGTSAEYGALTPDANTLYFITG